MSWYLQLYTHDLQRIQLGPLSILPLSDMLPMFFQSSKGFVEVIAECSAPLGFKTNSADALDGCKGRSFLDRDTVRAKDLKRIWIE